MSPDKSDQTGRTLGPLVSIILVITVLAIATSISFLIFWNSDSKQNIVLIQQFSQGDIDAEIPADFFDDVINNDDVLTISELLQIRRNINREGDSLVPSADFDGSELDKSKLGF